MRVARSAPGILAILFSLSCSNRSVHLEHLWSRGINRVNRRAGSAVFMVNIGQSVAVVGSAWSEHWAQLVLKPDASCTFAVVASSYYVFASCFGNT